LDWIAFPIFEGNSDTGFVFGAQASLIEYGDYVTPYTWRLGAKASYSTKNRHHHRILFEAPKWVGDDLELFAQLEFVHIADANWFGAGTQDLDLAADYQYRLTEPSAELALSKRFERFFTFGFGTKFRVSRVKTRDTDFIAIDRPLGFDGDRNVIGVLFFGFDNRDDPFSPRRGFDSEIYLKASAAPLSRYSWGGFGYRGSVFLPILPDLVFAQRVYIETLHGDVPASQLGRIGGVRSYRGLGGVFTQRGFAESRFAGASKALSNTELRFYFPPLWENLVFGLGAFVDTSKIVAPIATPYNASVGGEFTLAWRGAFLFRIDYGVGREGGEFYVEGRHLF
jgi:outer membrane protein assembly factor BamA